MEIPEASCTHRTHIGHTPDQKGVGEISRGCRDSRWGTWPEQVVSCLEQARAK
ncbi:hypothetical protein P7K49_020475 [Saguinus oedipus]|uniref:Uncharacterized protein n=1 Tax=Saguinus oedipus TaxID=9490 RepID=A0ABQ9V0D8_SAGOE|nr:hypothetical protein P7K49_020475 [Saguinus oedipus]